ncbi:prepilin peptidase [Buttiauxella warmboldiae]|uniref:Prepilin leader peptidase/N-methyltransferase n=1 Tax=Buttiauxella warmboldiae TaxID=82993 RepID=A0A3N5E3L8_9ENTR|nr:A24 family peptidase [Buttiauxella warmboldiae]RPH29609.1 prepilin peptidase [Buttiauxella warmboldiae]
MTLWLALDLIRQQALPLYIILFLLSGLILGSLMTMVVSRLQWALEREDVDPWFMWRPASHCPHCQTPIKWYYNLPLVGWLWLRGRCHHCQQPIDKLYPFLEGATGGIFALLAWVYPQPEVVLALALLSWFLLALAVLDFRFYFLPDSLTLPLLWAGLIWHSLMMPEQLDDALYGAVTAYLAFRALNIIWFALRGYDGIGRGDAKLLAALGAWLGWQSLPMICLIAGVTGIVGFVIFYGVRCASRQPLPFGVPLALAGWGLAFWQTWGL